MGNRMTRREVVAGAAVMALPAIPAMGAEGAGGMEAIMQRHVDAGEVAGMAWAVHRGGKSTFGQAGTFEPGGNGMPIGPETIFRVASITKPVTAATAMVLVERGVLDLDAPVDAWLPELANRRVLRSVEGPTDDTVPARGPITLRQLLVQTFGLGAIMVFPERHPIQAAMREAGIAPGPELPGLSEAAYMAALGRLPLAYQPGERLLYNNGLDVAGILISRAAGRRLGDVMSELVFEPLGMKDTGFFVPAGKTGRLPPLYMRAPDRTGLAVFDPGGAGSRFAEPPPMESGAGGLVTTTGDYLRFMLMLLGNGELDGVRVLSPASVDEMMTNQLSDAQRAHPDAVWFMYGGASGWGLGGSVALTRSEPWLVPGRYGWNGGYGTSAYVDRTSGIAAVYLSQKMMESPEPPAPFVDFWREVYRDVA